MERESMLEIEDRNTYFQNIIEGNPDFLKYPDHYANAVYNLLFLFFDGSEVFGDFAIVPGAKNPYDLVAIVDLTQEEKALYQIDKIECRDSTNYRTSILSTEGRDCLRIIMQNILDAHIYHTINDVYANLTEDE